MHGERHLLLLQLQGHWRCELHASPAWWSWWCWRSSLQSAGCRAPSSRHRRCIELFLQRIRVVWFQRFNVFQHVEKNEIQPTRENAPPPCGQAGCQSRPMAPAQLAMTTHVFFKTHGKSEVRQCEENWSNHRWFVTKSKVWATSGQKWKQGECVKRQEK